MTNNVDPAETARHETELQIRCGKGYFSTDVLRISIEIETEEIKVLKEISLISLLRSNLGKKKTFFQFNFAFIGKLIIVRVT